MDIVDGHYCVNLSISPSLNKSCY